MIVLCSLNYVGRSEKKLLRNDVSCDLPWSMRGDCVGTFVKWGIFGVHFYIHVVEFMCGQIQQNIQGIHVWCFSC